MIDFHVRCDICGQAAIWLTAAQAVRWAADHQCPTPTPQPDLEERNHGQHLG